MKSPTLKSGLSKTMGQKSTTPLGAWSEGPLGLSEVPVLFLVPAWKLLAPVADDAPPSARCRDITLSSWLKISSMKMLQL